MIDATPPDAGAPPVDPEAANDADADQDVDPGVPPPGVPGTQGTPVATAPATVRLVPSAPSYRIGDRVLVEVRIENATNVASVPFHLRYNRQVLEFVPPAGEGSFLKSDGVNSVFLAKDADAGGEIIVGHSRLGGGDGVSGAGTLATFQFHAINPGDCGFSWVGASVKDPQARNLPASFLTAPVAVEP